MRAMDCAFDVTTTLAEKHTTVDVAVDRRAATEAGTSEQEVSQFVATAINGIPAGAVTIDENQLDVVIATGSAPDTLSDIAHVLISTAYHSDQQACMSVVHVVLLTA